METKFATVATRLLLVEEPNNVTANAPLVLTTALALLAASAEVAELVKVQSPPCVLLGLLDGASTCALTQKELVVMSVAPVGVVIVNL
jgi:hypothetical protein